MFKNYYFYFGFNFLWYEQHVYEIHHVDIRDTYVLKSSKTFTILKIVLTGSFFKIKITDLISRRVHT